MENKKVTITIGIPAYNESQNIVYLLKSILAATTKSFTLEKIIVICDGSTDGTNELVSDLSRIHKLISLIYHTNRAGKKKRLMELYQQNNSDLLIILDGDVALANANTLEKMAQEFIKTKAAIVGGNAQAFSATNFVQKLMNTWEDIWFHAKINKNGRNNIHNISGCVMGLSHAFAKTIILPVDIISEAQFIYCLAKEKGLSFAFAEEAIVYYRKPASINDYFIQVNRYCSEKDKMAERFGTQVNKEFAIPIKNKVFAVLKNMIKDPVYTVLTFLFIFMLSHKKPKLRKEKNTNLWDTVTSTKEGININKI